MPATMTKKTEKSPTPRQAIIDAIAAVDAELQAATPAAVLADDQAQADHVAALKAVAAAAKKCREARAARSGLSLRAEAKRGPLLRRLRSLASPEIVELADAINTKFRPSYSFDNHLHREAQDAVRFLRDHAWLLSDDDLQAKLAEYRERFEIPNEASEVDPSWQ